MTCKDCIHYEVCNYHITEETPLTVDECSHGFKNKADFVEVVRCKKCKYSDVGIAAKSIYGQERKVWYCKLEHRITDADWYCPSGERK